MSLKAMASEVGHGRDITWSLRGMPAPEWNAVHQAKPDKLLK
jgi:hypothetical protein